MTLPAIIIGIVLGIIQGISEWLPISSKTQVLIASHYLLGLPFQQAYAFGLFMEIGTVIAAIIYFRKEIGELMCVLLGSKDAEKRKLFVFVLVAMVFTGLIGAPLYLIADSLTGVALGIPMLIIGVVLLGDAFLIRHSRNKKREGENVRKFDNMKLKDYAAVGVTQGIAALPGVSRSGITTSTMLLMKIEPDEAFRLSFLLSIFASIAAFGLTLVGTKANVSTAVSSLGLGGLGVAIITAVIVSLFLIDFLIRIAGKSKIVYLVAALGIIAILSGAISLATGVGG